MELEACGLMETKESLAKGGDAWMLGTLLVIFSLLLEQ